MCVPVLPKSIDHLQYILFHAELLISPFTFTACTVMSVPAISNGNLEVTAQKR